MRTWAEDQLAGVVGHVAAQVFLDVRVLVIVNAHAHVARRFGQPLDKARLADRRLALDEHRKLPGDNQSISKSNKQTNKQTNKERNKQINKQTSK